MLSMYFTIYQITSLPDLQIRVQMLIFFIANSDNLVESAKEKFGRYTLFSIDYLQY